MVTSVSANPTQLTGLMIREIAELQTKDKEFEKAIKNLKKNYTLKKLGNLQKKNIKNPQKFREKLREFTENFVQDYESFRQKYTDLFQTIIDTIDVSGREHTVELQKVDELMDHIIREAAANPQQFYFPIPARQKFAEEFKKAIDSLATQLKIEYAQLQGATLGKRVATGFLSRFIRSRSAGRTGIKKSKKLLEEVELVQQVVQEIEVELRDGIRQDFIALLLQYVMALEKTDESLKQIKKDIIIIVDNAIDEMRDVVQEIAKIMVVMESDPVAKPKLEKAFNDFAAGQRNVVNLLSQRRRWPKLELTIAKNLTEKERTLISVLSRINERHINARVQSVVNREMAGMAR